MRKRALGPDSRTLELKDRPSRLLTINVAALWSGRFEVACDRVTATYYCSDIVTQAACGLQSYGYRSS